MRCCADVRRGVGVIAIVGFAVASGGVAAQGTGTGTFTFTFTETLTETLRGTLTFTDSDLDVAAEAAALVAARWGVAASQVRVEPARGAAWPEDVEEIRLLGAGADGSWVVAYETSTGEGSLVIRAGVETEMAVAAHDIVRGAVLEMRDIAVRRDVRWGPPSSPEASVTAGWVARRRITAGEALDAAAVEPPLAVRAGQDVQIVWSNGSVQVSLQGRAAGRAAIGQKVYVRAGTGRRLEGTVIADGVVRVGPEGREP